MKQKSRIAAIARYPLPTTPKVDLFKLLPCSLQGSDGHLNVCGQEKEEVLIGQQQCSATRKGRSGLHQCQVAGGKPQMQGLKQ